MKKGILFILMSFSLTLYCQKNRDISIFYGASVPFGNFADKGKTQEDSGGAALIGSSFGIDFNYLLYKNYGLSLTLQRQQNGFDVRSLAESISNRLPNPYHARVKEYNKWDLIALMVGGYARFPLKNKISVETRVLLGVARCKSPYVSLDFYRNSTIIDSHNGYMIDVGATIGESYSLTLSSVIQTGIYYEINSHISLLFHIRVLLATPNFNIQTLSIMNDNIDTWVQVKQPINTVNFSLGLAYHF